MSIDDQSTVIDGGNDNTEGTELSEVSGLNGHVGEGTETTETPEPQSHPLPDELNRTTEPPLGIDGDKMVEKSEEPKQKPARTKELKQEQLTHKLYNQLIKKLQSGKTLDEMKQIQKRLARVEKNTSNIKLQQQLGKELLSQVRLMQRRLEKIDNAIGRSSAKGNVSQARKITKPKKTSR